MIENKAIVFKEIPTKLLVPRQHLAVEVVPYDPASLASCGIVLQSLYCGYDPFMYHLLRSMEMRSDAPTLEIRKPCESTCIARVIRSDDTRFPESSLVIGWLPLQQYIVLRGSDVDRIKLLDTAVGIDIRVYLGALGMPGLSAYSSLYEIAKAKRGETILISAACGTVGQIVGQLAKLEGLRVIGSVDSDEKLRFLVDQLGFDGGFNYKRHRPADALPALLPNGLDIYYDNVSPLAHLAPHGLDVHFENLGRDHLEAALEAMNLYGRVVVSGMISQLNTIDPARLGNFAYLWAKRLTLRGFAFSNPGFESRCAPEHLERMQNLIKDGSFRVYFNETVGIDNALDALPGIVDGRDFGNVVLKF